MYLEHKYGSHVRLLDDPFLLTLLARIGSPQTGVDAIPALVRSAYRRLCFEVLGREFPVVQQRLETRMTASEPRAWYEGPQLCRQTRLVIASVVRAGILPALSCYETACEVLPPGHVRLDYLHMSRATGAGGQVTGVQVDASKIGGPVDDAIVLIPDPMGATGGTTERVAQIYGDLPGGPPKNIVAVHLMVTPEAIVRLSHSTPPLRIYAGRLDRGLSPADVLKTTPGTHSDRERGLNDIQYIVPGAGGMGELMTNSWV
jgi:uracil phosphoribosyltransferase